MFEVELGVEEMSLFMQRAFTLTGSLEGAWVVVIAICVADGKSRVSNGARFFDFIFSSGFSNKWTSSQALNDEFHFLSYVISSSCNDLFLFYVSGLCPPGASSSSPSSSPSSPSSFLLSLPPPFPQVHPTLTHAHKIVVEQHVVFCYWISFSVVFGITCNALLITSAFLLWLISVLQQERKPISFHPAIS